MGDNLKAFLFSSNIGQLASFLIAIFMPRLIEYSFAYTNFFTLGTV
jgi:hypothetical protein